MAKGLPYFKFFPTEWMTGDICFEDLETQGLFINICALYWQRGGNITISDIEKRYKKPNALNSLLGGIISVCDEKIVIAFLDEQFNERNYKSVVNSKNGSKGGRPKTLSKKPNAKRIKTETKAKQSNIKEEKEVEVEVDKELEVDKETKENLVFVPKDDFDIDFKNDRKEYFNISDFEKKINEWIKYRKEIKKPLRQMSIEKLPDELRSLSGKDIQIAMKIIDQSIVSGYQGLFPLKTTLIQPQKDFRNQTTKFD